MSTCSSSTASCRQEYRYSLETLGPALLEQKAKGKIRHIGITEQPVDDFTHETLVRATQDDIWEVFMVALPHDAPERAQGPVPAHAKKRIGTLLMFAVRSIFAKPERVVAALREAAARARSTSRSARAPSRSASSFTTAAPPTSPRRRIGLRVTSRASTWCCSAPASRASAHQHRVAARAAAARGGPGQACDAVRSTAGVGMDSAPMQTR